MAQKWLEWLIPTLPVLKPRASNEPQSFRLTFFEFNRLRTTLPAIVNGLPTDDLYNPSFGSEPQRSLEVVQSWEGVKTLNAQMAGPDPAQAVKVGHDALKQAGLLYEAIQARGVRLDPKSNAEHLQPLTDGLELYTKLAEL